MSEPFSGPVSRSDILARIRAHPLGDDAVTQRRHFEQLVVGRARSDSPVETIDLPGRPDGEPCTIVYFHGGGYAFGSPLTHLRICGALADRTGARVFAPSYPRAPEHQWPAQLDAAVAALATVADPVVLAGDSAGGHLAIVTALELARRGRPMAGLLLFSPNTDRSGLSTTREQNEPYDPMVDDAEDRRLARQCFGDLPDDHHQVSPVLDDLTMLPPLYIEVGADEVLLGDSMVLAHRARTAGCDVTMHVAPNGLHMWQLWVPWWPEATASIDRAARFVRTLAVDAASDNIWSAE